jgi:hypothetical protein
LLVDKLKGAKRPTRRYLDVDKIAEWGDIAPIFADSESDTQQYCCQCHELIDNKYIMWAIPGKLAREVGIEPTDTLPSFAWPGGYQLIYFDVHMEVICPDCANSYDERPNVDSVSLYQEGPAIQCDVCGKMIESDYGDPNEEITD